MAIIITGFVIHTVGLHWGVHLNSACVRFFAIRYKYKSTDFQKFICMIRDLSDTNVLDSTTFFPFLASLPVPRVSSFNTAFPKLWVASQKWLAKFCQVGRESASGIIYFVIYL